MLIAAHFLQRLWMGQKIVRLNQGQENAVPSPSSRPDFTRVMSSLESEGVDIGVNRATRWLIASAVIVFVCGVLAIVLPLTFSIGVAGLLGWLFFFAAVAHLVFGIHFGSGTLA
jgi:hypothetical protein